MWFFNKLRQKKFAPVMELAYMPALEAGFWEFNSPLGHQFSVCIVSQVDGLPWKQEDAGSKPATQTNLNREAAGVADRLSICRDGIDTHAVLQISHSAGRLLVAGAVS